MLRGGFLGEEAIPRTWTIWVCPTGAWNHPPPAVQLPLTPVVLSRGRFVPLMPARTQGSAVSAPGIWREGPAAGDKPQGTGRLPGPGPKRVLRREQPCSAWPPRATAADPWPRSFRLARSTALRRPFCDHRSPGSVPQMRGLFGPARPGTPRPVRDTVGRDTAGLREGQTTASHHPRLPHSHVKHGHVWPVWREEGRGTPRGDRARS